MYEVPVPYILRGRCTSTVPYLCKADHKLYCSLDSGQGMMARLSKVPRVQDNIFVRLMTFTSAGFIDCDEDVR